MITLQVCENFFKISDRSYLTGLGNHHNKNIEKKQYRKHTSLTDECDLD